MGGEVNGSIARSGGPAGSGIGRGAVALAPCDPQIARVMHLRLLPRERSRRDPLPLPPVPLRARGVPATSRAVRVA
jgi:hypothetical protein